MASEIIMPQSAKALIVALAQTFDPPVPPDVLLRPTTRRRMIRNRHRVWKALRDQRDELDRHLYSLEEIGRWFGVKRWSVYNAVRALDG